MTKHYGNVSNEQNQIRLDGLQVDKTKTDLSVFLTNRQKERQRTIDENNHITFLLKDVHEHPKFKKDRIYFQDNIKLLKGADSFLKKIFIRELEECKNDDFKIINLLKTVHLHV